MLDERISKATYLAIVFDSSALRLLLKFKRGRLLIVNGNVFVINWLWMEYSICLKYAFYKSIINIGYARNNTWESILNTKSDDFFKVINLLNLYYWRIIILNRYFSSNNRERKKNVKFLCVKFYELRSSLKRHYFKNSIYFRCEL